MLNDIASMAEYTAGYTGFDQLDESVMEALRQVNRADFVQSENRRFAYVNRPLPIGHGQTISQPFIVALMTHVLEIEITDKVLEVGTGSGYQAAILGELADRVFTIEIVEPLALQARERLADLAYDNVFVKVGDGWFGITDEAPFDKIMVTAVAPSMPQMLLDQLKVGGKLVLPIGEYDGFQELVLVEKLTSDRTEQRSILPVQFVPMTGEASKHR